MTAAAGAPEVPASLDELLEPGWLTEALGIRFPGVHVVAVTPGPVVERLSTNARFRIECDPAPPDGLVPTLCAKGYFSELGRPIAHVGEPEACFYRDLAGATGVHTLRSVYADVHPETRHGVVITEDVIEAGGTFLDALSPYTAGPGGREPRGAGPAARLDVGRHRAHARAVAGLAPPERLRAARREGDPEELRGPAGARRPRRRARTRTPPRRVPHLGGARASDGMGGHPR